MKIYHEFKIRNVPIINLQILMLHERRIQWKMWTVSSIILFVLGMTQSVKTQEKKTVRLE